MSALPKIVLWLDINSCQRLTATNAETRRTVSSSPLFATLSTPGIFSRRTGSGARIRFAPLPTVSEVSAQLEIDPECADFWKNIVRPISQPEQPPPINSNSSSISPDRDQDPESSSFWRRLLSSASDKSNEVPSPRCFYSSNCLACEVPIPEDDFDLESESESLVSAHA